MHLVPRASEPVVSERSSQDGAAAIPAVGNDVPSGEYELPLGSGSQHHPFALDRVLVRTTRVLLRQFIYMFASFRTLHLRHDLAAHLNVAVGVILGPDHHRNPRLTLDVAKLLTMRFCIN